MRPSGGDISILKYYFIVMVTLDDAIAEFYKLRGSYEKALRVRRRKIMRNPDLSKGEKLRALSAVTGACYACGRKGHMAFRETKTMLAVTCAAQRVVAI